MGQNERLLMIVGLGGVGIFLALRYWQQKEAAEEALTDSMRETDAALEKASINNGGTTLAQQTFGVAGRLGPIPEYGAFYYRGVGGI